MRRIIISAMLAVAAAGVYAQSALKPQLPFVAQKGVQEFTGEMIARPMQINDLLAKGTPYAKALAMSADARARLAPYTMQYEPRTDYYVIKLPRDTNEYLMNRDLMATGEYEYVEPNWRVYPAYVPNDPLFGQQWHHAAGLGNREGWDLFRGNGTLIVALCDTGVRHAHEDLASRLVPGYNAVQGKDEATWGSSYTEDLNGHGTHTHGCAAAEGNNGKGVTGVGMNLKLMPIRVSDSSGGGSSIATLDAGAMWAVDHGARAINTSYSGVNSSAVETTGLYIKNHNGISCWAAGNDGATNNVDHADVTIVGALDYPAYNTIVSWSNRGLATDVMEPGVKILSSIWNSNSSYGEESGTSMASPLCAGTAGMVMASNPVITGADVETILYNTCVDLGASGDDSIYGHGRVNLHDALAYAYNNFGFQPSSVNLYQGTLVSGGLPEVKLSDNLYLVGKVNPAGLGSELIGIEYQTTTTLLAIGSIQITYESHAASQLVQKLEMYNNSSASWVPVDTRTIGSSDTTITVSPPGNASEYANANGLMKVRARYLASPNSIGQVQVFVDYINTKTKP